MPPPPASGNLNSHAELSVWSSTSVMRLIVLRPQTKFEVRRPTRSENVADFGHSVKRSSDLDI